MKKCPECNAENPDRALFCCKCGRAFEMTDDVLENGSTSGTGGESAMSGHADAGAASYNGASLNGNPYNGDSGNGQYNSGRNYGAPGGQYSGGQNYGGQYNGSQNYGGSYNTNAGNYSPQMNGHYQSVPYLAKKRSIALCIVFSILTCGIYYYYWIYRVNNESAELAGDINATSGGLVVLFSIITFGIYYLYWLFKLGQRYEHIKGNYASDNGSAILFLVIGIFGLGIIGVACAQDEINKAVQDVYGY